MDANRKKEIRKRILNIAKWALAGLAVLVIGLIVCLNPIVKNTVTKVGTLVTGTGVELQKARIFPLIGKVHLEGMSVLNPKGYVNPNAISFGAFTVQVSPISLLTDKIEIKTIRMEKLTLDLEIHQKGTNLGDIKKNVDAFTEKLASAGNAAEEEESVPAEEEEQPKKMVIRQLQIVDSSIHLANPNLNLDLTIPLPDIEMTDVGDGRSISELAQVLYDAIYEAVMSAAKSSGDVMGSAMESTGKKLQDAAGKFSDSAKSMGIDAADAAREIGKGLKKSLRGLF